MRKDHHADAGSISIEAGRLRFDSESYGKWEAILDSLSLVGEYTTQDGPMIEDHFFVFVSKRGEEFECPVTAQGVSEMLQALSRIFDAQLDPKLTLTTDFASRIMAPRSLEDQPLYTFQNEERSLLKRLFTIGRVTRRLSPMAESVLESTRLS